MNVNEELNFQKKNYFFFFGGGVVGGSGRQVGNGVGGQGGCE